MQISIDIGDDGLKRQLQEAKSMNRTLKNKAAKIQTAIDQVKNQLELRAKLLRQLAQIKGENKEWVTTTNQSEGTLKDLMKEAVV